MTQFNLSRMTQSNCDLNHHTQTFHSTSEPISENAERLTMRLSVKKTNPRREQKQIEEGSGTDRQAER